MKVKMTSGLFALSLTTMLVGIAPLRTKGAKLEHFLLRRVAHTSNEDKVSRELKGASKDFVGSDTPPPGYPVWEKKPCVPFTTISDTQKYHENSEASCANNECSGCCRSYHWLLCDEGDAFPSVACICNENTRDPTTFTAAPIVNNFPVPVTVQPATAPTLVAAPVPTPTDIPQGEELESVVEEGSIVLLLPGPSQGLDCIPVAQVTAERNHYRTDEGCREVDWGQCEGYCRVFAWLICEKDEDGQFLSQLAKVCGTETNTTRGNPDDEPF